MSLQNILSWTPVYNWWTLLKLKKAYKSTWNAMEEMLSSDDWGIVASNYHTDDIIYDKDNNFLYINTGQTFVPQLDPDVITITWMRRWVKQVEKWADNFSIDTIVPTMNNDEHNNMRTYLIWIHPETVLEAEYIEQRYRTRLSTVWFLGSVSVISLITTLIMNIL